MKQSIWILRTPTITQASAVLLIVLLCSACQTMHTVSDTTANHHSDRYQRDSIYLHESTAVVYKLGLSNNVPAHGLTAEGGLTDACIGPTSAPCRVDTLLVHELHTRWRDRETVKTDSITLTETRTETVQVRHVPSFYKYCALTLAIIVFILLLRLAWWCYRKFYL